MTKREQLWSTFEIVLGNETLRSLPPHCLRVLVAVSAGKAHSSVEAQKLIGMHRTQFLRSSDRLVEMGLLTKSKSMGRFGTAVSLTPKAVRLFETL